MCSVGVLCSFYYYFYFIYRKRTHCKLHCNLMTNEVKKPFTKPVTLLKFDDCERRNGIVYVPNTIEMARIKKTRKRTVQKKSQVFHKYIWAECERYSPGWISNLWPRCRNKGMFFFFLELGWRSTGRHPDFYSLHFINVYFNLWFFLLISFIILSYPKIICSVFRHRSQSLFLYLSFF